MDQGYSHDAIERSLYEGSPNMLRTANMLERVSRQLASAKEEVERLTELKSLLEKNPEIQRIMELISEGI